MLAVKIENSPGGFVSAGTSSEQAEMETAEGVEAVAVGQEQATAADWLQTEKWTAADLEELKQQQMKEQAEYAKQLMVHSSQANVQMAAVDQKVIDSESAADQQGGLVTVRKVEPEDEVEEKEAYFEVIDQASAVVIHAEHRMGLVTMVG